MTHADRTPLPPLSKRVSVVAGLVLGLTLASVVLDGRRRPPSGELLVQADSGKVRVSVRQGPKVVIPPTDRRSFHLPPGAYEVEADLGGSKLRVNPSRVVVTRGVRAVVQIESQ